MSVYPSPLRFLSRAQVYTTSEPFNLEISLHPDLRTTHIHPSNSAHSTGPDLQLLVQEYQAPERAVNSLKQAPSRRHLAFQSLFNSMPHAYKGFNYYLLARLGQGPLFDVGFHSSPRPGLGPSAMQ